MGTFGAILRIVVQRNRAGWKALATVVAGILLAAALMASVVVYSDTIRDLGLRYALRQQDASSLDLLVVSSTQPLRLADYAQHKEKTAALLQVQAGDVLTSTVRSGHSATFFLAAPGEVLAAIDVVPRANFDFLEGLADNVRVVDGRALSRPSIPADAAVAPEMDVWMAKMAADRLGVRVGSRFELHPFWKLDAAPVLVTVAGLFEPVDPTARYWSGRPGRFDDATTSWQTYSFIVAEEALPAVLAAYLPDIDGNLETVGFIDAGRINSRNARSVEGRVRGLEGALAQAIPRTSLSSQLPATIEQFRTRLFFTRLPLFALMLQVVAICLYYLVVVATMLVERQAGEIALLKSRGASVGQIVGVYAVEAGLYSVVSAVLGPLVAAGAIALLGPTPPFADLSGGKLLPVYVSSTAFGMAGLGAALAFGAMLWPAYRAARRTMVDYKHQLTRPPQQSLFLKYYLDLAVLGAGALAFYELRQRGSLVTGKLFGELSADPLLLASPILFMFMIALAFLRLFPVGLRVVAWLARATSGAVVSFGLWRLVRSPLHYSRLILLLLLATAVGMFAAGFRATLEKSYDDRSAYMAGADGRIQGVREPTNLTTTAFDAAVRDATGAGQVSAAARIDASYTASRFRFESASVLGVVPGEFEGLAFWRNDFAVASLSSLMSRLKEPAPPLAVGAEVPAGAQFLGLWAQFPLAETAAQLNVRLQDPDGVYWEYRLTTSGASPVTGWRFFVADLSRPAQVRYGSGPALSLSVPRRLDSVFVRLTGTPPPIPERISVLLSEVQVTSERPLPPGLESSGFTAGTVIERFDDPGRYESIAGASSTGEPGALSRAEVTGRDTALAARIAFTRQQGVPPIVGLRLRGGAVAVPALASQSFIDSAKAKNGDEVTVYLNRQYMKVKIVGAFDLFPGYNAGAGRHLLVVDLAWLQLAAARVPGLADGVFVNEAWMSGVPPDALAKEVLEGKGLRAESVYDRSELRAEQASDPLVAASWEGILFLSFAAVLSLTALGFAVYAALAAQSRGLEFAVLRTMGFSSRQILALVSFEQAFVVVSGMVVGTLMGFPLGRLMVSYLGVTESGKDPLPPLLSHVSWGAVAVVDGLLAVVFVGTIASLATIYSRLAVHRVLRIGEL